MAVIQGNGVPVTISVGSAFSIPRRTDADLDRRLIATADEAMYASKRAGRNQCHMRVLTDEAGRKLAERATACRFSRWLVNKQVLDIPTVSKALVRSNTRHVRIGELGIRWGFLDTRQVNQICLCQEQSGDRFGETAIRLGLLTEETVAVLLALQKDDPGSLSRSIIQLGLLEECAISALQSDYMAELNLPAHEHELIAT